MWQQAMSTTTPKRAGREPRIVAGLRTARAKIMASRFLRTCERQIFGRVGRESDRDFQLLLFELTGIQLRVKERLDEKSPGLSLANFPGPAAEFDLSQTGDFQRRAFEVFSAFDQVIVFLESAWLHHVVSQAEHASVICSCEGRIYETLMRVAQRCGGASVAGLLRRPGR